MIRVLCPHCKRRYRTVTEVMGRQAVCHNCHITFVIGQQRPPFAWKSADLAEDSWIGVEPPGEKQEIKHCLICDAPLKSGAVRCPECGANQVTGVVHRGQSAAKAGTKPSWASFIPWRYLVIAAAVAAVSLGSYWLFSAFQQSAAQVGDDLVDQVLVNRAARFLRDTGDEIDFARAFAGQVTGDNLPRLISRLAARDPVIRKAATLLIGSGRFTNLQPLLSAADAPDTALPAREALQAVGSRRLADLSCDPDDAVRLSAARALCILLGLRGDEPLKKLAAPVSADQKIAALNELCRWWPEATGPFVAVINDQRSPVVFQIDQVARTFYLHAGNMEFRSLPDDTRTFEIPIEYWCAATAQAVDVADLRRFIGGQVRLASPHGAGWEGTLAITVRQPLLADLPGFLPLQVPNRGKTIEAPIRLARPGR